MSNPNVGKYILVEAPFKDEPPEPEVLTVRMKKDAPGYEWIKCRVGEVIEVVKKYYTDGSWFYDYNGLTVPVDCFEKIPPYNKTTHRLRRKYKDEEKIGEGDLIWSESTGEWRGVTHEGSQRGYIFITPLKPATPDPSADCLPGFEAVRVIISGPWLYAPQPGITEDRIDHVVALHQFSGRYGYKREDGTIYWTRFSRAYNSESDGLYSGVYKQYNTPVLPSFVEMAKESE